MGSNVCWGVDIGYSSIKAVKIQRTKRDLEIVGIDVVEVEPKSPDSEDYNREEAIREGLTIFLNRNKVRNDPFYVSIPGQGIFNRTISLPPVEPKRIPEIVKFEAQQQIPFPIDEVIWDYQPLGDPRETGGEFEVSLFAAKREVVQNFLVNLRAADVSVHGIQIAPLALFNYFTYDQPSDGAVVVIDIGAESTDLVVIDGPRVWTRNLQFAGNDITRALQKKFQIPFEEAEKLKLKAKRSKQAKKIFNIIRPVLKDMVNEIHRSVGYYKSVAKGVKFDRMVFLGSATKMMGFKRFFSQNLQYQVEVFSGIERIRVSPRANVDLLQENMSSLPIALGLAIQGLGLAANNIELLPADIKQAKAIQQKKPMMVFACVIFALVLAISYMRRSGVHSELQAGLEGLNKPGNALGWFDQANGQMHDARNTADLQQKIDTLLQLGRSRRVWPEVIDRIATLVPPENQLNMTDFSQETLRKKVWFLQVGVALAKDVPEEKVDEYGDPIPSDPSSVQRYLDVMLEVAAYYEKNAQKEVAKDLLDEKIQQRSTQLRFENPQLKLDAEEHAPIWARYEEGEFQGEDFRTASELAPVGKKLDGGSNSRKKRYMCRQLSLRILLQDPKVQVEESSAAGE